MFEATPAAYCPDCGRALDPAGVCLWCATCAHGATGADRTRCQWCNGSASQAEAARKGAFAAADADPEWMHTATRALAVVRNHGVPFTSAEVRATLESWGVDCSGRNALGALFASAAAGGVIRATGDFVPSPVRGQHGRPLRVWISSGVAE
jgi:hypothetical protein